MKKRAPKPPKLAHPLDIALGARIKEVRTSQAPRVTLQWLAQEIGCKAQQVQKYENGENRVSFSRLCEIAKALDVSVLDLIAPLIQSDHSGAATSPDAMPNSAP